MLRNYLGNAKHNKRWDQLSTVKLGLISRHVQKQMEGHKKLDPEKEALPSIKVS